MRARNLAAVTSGLFALAASTTFLPAASASVAGPSEASSHHLSTSSASAGDAAKGSGFLAGFLTKPRGGVQSMTSTVTVPTAICTSTTEQGTAFGVGSEDTLAAPIFVSDVIVACLGEAQPYYALDVVVCGAGEDELNVAPGDVVTTTMRYDGAQVIVTATDAASGASAAIEGDPAQCSGGQGPLIASATTGAFPVFDGDATPLLFPQFTSKQGVKKQYAEMTVDRSTKLKKQVLRGGDFIVTPQFTAGGVMDINPNWGFDNCHKPEDPVIDSYVESWQEEGDPTINRRAADDMTFPYRCNLTVIKGPGVLMDPTIDMDNATITIYADDPWRPGYPTEPADGQYIFQETAALSTPNNGSDRFRFTIPYVWLDPNQTYWVSVQANTASGWGWYWEGGRILTGNGAVYEGYHRCYPWGRLADCGIYGTDLNFNVQ